MSSEAKVGMFFLVALLLVGAIALYLGDFWVRARSYPVTAYFANVQGLPAGAEVRFAGVKVGRVNSVTLESNSKYPDRPAAVKMAIFHDTVLYRGDQFLVQQSALLGDKYVEVKREVKTPRDRLAAGAEVQGDKSPGIESMAEDAQGLIKEARATLAVVRESLASQDNKVALQQILANVVAATGKANTLASQAMQLANMLTKNTAQAGPSVVQMAANLKDASASVKSTAQLVRVLLATSPVPRDASVASGNLRKASENLAAMSDNVAKMLADPALRDKVQSALDNLHQSTDNLARLTGQAAKLFDDQGGGKDIREILTHMREAAANLSDVTGTYDKLLTDPKFTTDIQQTVSSTRKAVEGSSKMLAQAGQTLDRVDQTMNRLTALTRSVNPEQVRGTVSLEAAQHAGLRADVKADLQYGPNRNNFWRVGVRDVGDAETLILQRALPLGRNAARAGIYGNKLGVGFDFNPEGRLGFEADLWNPNDPRLDLRGTYSVGSRVDALFGLNDVASDTEPFIGVRYRSSPSH